MSDEEIMTGQDTVETATHDDAPSRPPKRGFYLTARQAFGILAGVLAAMLIALVVWLLFFMGGGSSLVTRGGSARAGIKPLFTIDGPGTGALPRFDRPMRGFRHRRAHLRGGHRQQPHLRVRLAR